MKLTDIEIPPDVARLFVRDMHAYFAASNQVDADEIAGRQLYALKQYYPGKLSLSDVEEMFFQMRDGGSF